MDFEIEMTLKSKAMIVKRMGFPNNRQNPEIVSFISLMTAKVLVGLGSLILLSCSTVPHATTPQSPKQIACQGFPIVVTNHGWHTGLLVSAARAHLHLPFLKDRFPKAQFYEFGWGDADFYQAEEVTTGLALSAMLWPSDSVVHVVGLQTYPDQAFLHLERLTISIADENETSFFDFLKQSFAYDDQRRVTQTKKGLYGNSQFYKGYGSYFLSNTCNHWSAKALQSGGVDISSWFKWTAGSVMSATEDELSALSCDAI